MIDDGSATITNCTFENVEENPLYLSVLRVGNYKNCLFYNNVGSTI